MITSFEPSRRKGTLFALLAVMLLTVTALTGEEETALANQQVAGVKALPSTSVPRVLLAMEQPKDTEAIIPSAITDAQAVAPQTTPVTEKSAVEKATAASETKPVKKDSNRVAALKNTNKPVVMAKAELPESKRQPDADSLQTAETETVTPAVGAEKTDSNAPASLHSAINKAAEDYARSLEAKSTRPGEDLPFSITVGGSIQVRAQYWSNMPKNARSGLTHNSALTPEMRTRLKLCADFGQVQAVVEGSVTGGGSRFFGSRDAD